MDKKRVISGLSAFAASIMLLSCTDRTWVGVVEGEYEDAEDALPIPVIVGVGNPSLESKGSGAIDSDEGNPFSDVDVYVYAFNSTSGAPFRNTARSRPDACLIDGSLDFPNTNAGRRAHFDGKELYLQWPDAASETYYPASTDAWTFYAYYIDGYQPTRITRNNDDITIPIVIDGAMDVMTGRAVYDESVLDNTFSDTEKSLIRQRAFSAYTARRGVNPIITFRHHLTRLRFVLYPASDDSYTVVVNSIKVQSKNTGTFTAVARDISDEGIEFSSAMAELELSEADGSPLRQDVYHTSENADLSLPLYERRSVQVGGSLLVAPDVSYKAVISLYEKKGVGYSGQSEISISSPSGGFRAGEQYSVRIAVYGMSEVRVSVQIEPWGYGGSLILDNEEIYSPTYN